MAQDAGLEFTRADVVVSISRGPPGQWFPETEYWASAIFVGTSGIPPKIIYRSVKSYKCKSPGENSCSLSLPNYSVLDLQQDSLMHHEKVWLVVQATILHHIKFLLERPKWCPFLNQLFLSLSLSLSPLSLSIYIYIYIFYIIRGGNPRSRSIQFGRSYIPSGGNGILKKFLILLF